MMVFVLLAASLPVAITELIRFIGFDTLRANRRFSHHLLLLLQ